jgi:chromosomal replication initiator protein
MWSEAKPDPSALWKQFLRVVEPKLSAHVIDNWLRPVRCTGFDGEIVTLEVRDDFFRNWLLDHYFELLRSHLADLVHAPISVVVTVQAAATANTAAAKGAKAGAPEPPARAPAAKAGAETGPTAGRSRPANDDRDRPQPPKLPANKRRGKAKKSSAADLALEASLKHRPLNDRYTFERFVEGPSNHFASAACRAAAENPGHSYNPLFIFGGVGLGKTHLLSAIGHHIRGRDRQARVHYTSSEQFTSDVINAVLSGRLEEFRERTRDGIDVLLIDDIQLIAGKERTQHEFFQLFNAMYDSHRQIVVTSDKLPHEIPDIEERLRNRFQWGLIADVQPPEVETRIAILRKKAELEQVELPNEVAFFLARAIRSNVRELEGALVRITAQASLTNSPLTLEYVRTSMTDIAQHALSELSVESIQRAVAQFYAVRQADLRGTGRKKEVVRARQVAMFLCRKHLGVSYPEIGARFGKKDHTTAMSACVRIADTQHRDAALRGQLQDIEHRMECSAP